ncbi:MAG: cobyric acid synthase CobQ, partial [Gammaproteobacteria bacterium]|nr:cobyric acid synthase CobQ [Gammaproteobacteria bacterium]MBV1733833.1 cobyric acid synthase CobQ [Hydrogenophaga sp.]
TLLAPGPQMLQDLTGVPTVATLPMWWQHGLPEEDGVFDDRTLASGAVQTTIAVIAWPRISNLDEFQPLKNVPGVRLVWARSPADCTGADWIVLPGSKATVADLAWLRAQGLDRAVAQHAAQGGVVLGICGGLQMLGEALIDTHGIDGNAPGLGLLPLVTAFDPQKTVRHTQARFSALAGPWRALSGVETAGYEIHHGQTALHPAMAAKGDVAREVIPGLAWQNTAGNVLGVYLHGLFEDPRVLHALFGASAPTLESVFDGLADFLQTHVEPGVLDALIQPD